MEGIPGNTFVGSSLPFNLVGPNEMVVQGDFWEYCDGCSSAIKSVTTYKVLNSDASAAGNIPIGENPAYANWTCNQAKPKFGVNSCTVAAGQSVGGFESIGMGATSAEGLFTDGWSLSSDAYTPNSCGFNVVFDEWQFCGLASVYQCVLGGRYPNYGLTFATLSGAIHKTEVDITISGSRYFNRPEQLRPPDDLSDLLRSHSTRHRY